MRLKGRERSMRCRATVFFVGLFSIVSAFAQNQGAANEDQAAMVAFAQKAAVQALNFRQGDLESLTAVRSDFTPEAWQEYMKHMEGFLDENGAPTYGSSFVPSRSPVVLAQQEGMVQIRIPGKLTQTRNRTSTTYSRFAVEVQVGGDPIKIRRLEQLTCRAASPACE